MHDNHLKTPAHWGLLATILWGGLLFIISNIAQVAAMTAWLDHHGQPLDDMSDALFDGNVLSVALMVSMFISLSSIAAVINFKKNSHLFDYLALKPFDTKAWWRWLLGLLAIVLLADLILSFNPGNQNELFMRSIVESADPQWWLWMAVMLAAPLSEELFFRGFLFKGLQTSVLGVSGTILLTSVLWAAIHLQYDAMYIGVIFLLGTFFGYARHKTGSILLPIIMHVIFNGIAMAQTAYSL
jgi:membrane protease YdiL (CAAX protease family)